MTPLTADTPAPDWIVAGWIVLVALFALAIVWSCYRAWKDRNREEPTDE